MPSALRYSAATPSPIASPTAGVPASNFQGMSFNSHRRRWTSRIISPPARNGGIASSSSRRAHSAPEPIGAEHLVAAERVEVGAELLDVDRHVRHGLGAVDQDERAGRVGHLDHLADRVDRPERVRDVGERDELRLEPEQDLEDVEAEEAVVGDRDELEVAVLLLDEELPRDEVRVVLHLGQDDRVAARRCSGGPTSRRRG